MSDWSYRGRWALVTGASAGLGAIFAEQLAARGMKLVLSARRADRLETLARRLEREHGVETFVVTEDLTAPGAAGRLWARAAEGRAIDLLVNNAGFGAQGRFSEIELDRQTTMIQVNCVALLELAHHAIAEMRPRGRGGIINVASLAGFQPVPRMATYAATKAFALSLSEALWAENRDFGLRIVALCPGRTPTEFQQIAGSGSAEGVLGARDPEAVVLAGLKALEQNRIHVVPGLENHLGSLASRMAPRAFLTRFLEGRVRRAARR